MFITRLITTLVLSVLIFSSLLLPPSYFQCLITIPLILAAYEFSQLIALPKKQRLFYCLLILLLYGLSHYFLLDYIKLEPTGFTIWFALLFSYLFFLVLYAIFVAGSHWQLSVTSGTWGIISLLSTVQVFVWLQEHHLYALGTLIVTVAGVDIGGYVFGKLWGRKKLVPQISPGKTWAGLYGSALIAWIFNAIYLSLTAEMNFHNLLFITLISVLLTPISLLGDLFESLLKRRQGLKDSGTLIPGHGGIMDRIDGLVLATPAYFLLLTGFNYLSLPLL